MEFERTNISDVILCKPKVLHDSRGYFVETFRQDALEDFLGQPVRFCQDNESESVQGVLRGLHYQMPPFAQAKLVRVISGAVLDIAVDIRTDSPTFGKHVAIELNDQNKYQLFIPQGFAHGYSVLSKNAVFAYKVNNYYDRPSERGMLYSDPALNIDWRMNNINKLISDKDMSLPLFNIADKFDPS